MPACADMCEAREGTMQQEKGANSKDNWFVFMGPDVNNLLISVFTFTEGWGRERNITHSGESSMSEDLLCLTDDPHLNHWN